MDKLFKQCVGIDISKSTFTACICKSYISDLAEYTEVQEFENTKTGFNQLLKWSRKHLSKEIPSLYLMEATGVYYESLAYHLSKLKLQVSVVLPNKAKYYAMYLCIKTKNDAMDAQVLSSMGCLQALRLWNPPLPIYRELRALTRFYSEMIKRPTVLKNHLEALTHAEEQITFVLKSHKKMLATVEKTISATVAEIEGLVKSNPELSNKIKKLETIKGVGFATIVTIIAETQGFELITSRKQLASYAGFDVTERQSGTSVYGRTRISKKGNSRIRSALYFPAMVASKYNNTLREDYQRIIEKNPRAKKIGITALQRKLLLLIYTLWKSGDTYKEN